MQTRRRDGHGIRIPDDLWAKMGQRAEQQRRTHTLWAHVVLDAAAEGIMLPLPRMLARRLERWAHREGVDPWTLATRILEAACRHPPREQK